MDDWSGPGKDDIHVHTHTQIHTCVQGENRNRNNLVAMMEDWTDSAKEDNLADCAKPCEAASFSSTERASASGCEKYYTYALVNQYGYVRTDVCCCHEIRKNLYKVNEGYRSLASNKLHMCEFLSRLIFTSTCVMCYWQQEKEREESTEEKLKGYMV